MSSLELDKKKLKLKMYGAYGVAADSKTHDDNFALHVISTQFLMSTNLRIMPIDKLTYLNPVLKRCTGTAVTGEAQPTV